MRYGSLSKEISYALRHCPWEYELEIDEDGWVPIGQLLSALNRTSIWKEITEADIMTMIEKSEKKRHEVVNGKIRAYYGHSIPHKIIKEEREPPNILYHGTSRQSVTSIMKNGLLPSKRQYVHLSTEYELALSVGKRHDKNPVILSVDTFKAKTVVKFYYGNDKVWLADFIPSHFLKIM